MIVLVSLCSCVIFLTFIYFGGQYNERYWTKRGVTFYKRNKFLGVVWDYLTNDRAFFEHFHDIYKKYGNEPAVGFGSLFKPSLFIIDPTNIQHILVTDFNSFTDRSFVPNKEDLLAKNLLFLGGKKWKIMRQNMTPLFTSAKLKFMYNTIDKSAQDFVSFMKQNPRLLKGNAFTTLSAYCCDAISTAMFGITSHSYFDNPFLKMAQTAFSSSFIRDVRFCISLISTKLIHCLKINFFTEFQVLFISAVKKIISQRKAENLKRHDFADLCVAIQQNGPLKDVDYTLEPTDEFLAAQGFFFFNAGVEPTASSIFHMLVALGNNFEVLKRLQREIDDAFEKTQGNITYEVISEMEYLDMVMNESMRIYPAIGYLIRRCVKDTILPIGNITIDKGSTIILPLFPIQHDPQYYPDPEVFNPERFSREYKSSVMDHTFLAFGKGKRKCIGMRYAQLQIKTSIIYLLRNFSVNTVLKNERQISYSRNQVQVRLSNVDVEFIERN